MGTSSISSERLVLVETWKVSKDYVTVVSIKRDDSRTRREDPRREPTKYVCTSSRLCEVCLPEYIFCTVRKLANKNHYGDVTLLD